MDKPKQREANTRFTVELGARRDRHLEVYCAATGEPKGNIVALALQQYIGPRLSGMLKEMYPFTVDESQRSIKSHQNE